MSTKVLLADASLSTFEIAILILVAVSIALLIWICVYASNQDNEQNRDWKNDGYDTLY